MRVFVCVVARVRAYVAVSECVSDLNVCVKRSSRVKKNTRESRFPTRPAGKIHGFPFLASPRHWLHTKGFSIYRSCHAALRARRCERLAND